MAALLDMRAASTYTYLASWLPPEVISCRGICRRDGIRDRFCYVRWHLSYLSASNVKNLSQSPCDHLDTGGALALLKAADARVSWTHQSTSGLLRPLHHRDSFNPPTHFPDPVTRMAQGLGPMDRFETSVSSST